MGGYSDKCPTCGKWYTDRGALADHKKACAGPKTFHVTLYYLATGMEGNPMTEDFGYVEAHDSEAAKDAVIASRYARSNPNDQAFIRGCLTAKRVG